MKFVWLAKRHNNAVLSAVGYSHRSIFRTQWGLHISLNNQVVQKNVSSRTLLYSYFANPVAGKTYRWFAPMSFSSVLLCWPPFWQVIPSPYADESAANACVSSVFDCRTVSGASSLRSRLVSTYGNAVVTLPAFRRSVMSECRYRQRHLFKHMASPTVTAASRKVAWLFSIEVSP